MNLKFSFTGKNILKVRSSVKMAENIAVRYRPDSSIPDIMRERA